MSSTTTVHDMASEDNAPRGNPAWRKGLSATVAVVFALMVLAACGNPFVKNSSGHACADKVAAALAVTTPTTGVWNCLASSLQTSLRAYGYDGDKAFEGALPAISGASYMGSTKDMATYGYTVKTINGSTETVVVVVWTDSKGLVTNIGLGTQLF